MNQQAKGSFEVEMAPQSPQTGAADAGISRMLLDKRFEGDLEGTSKGQMLAVRTEIDGSAGYVAMERITGTLGGRSGSFALQHTGTMNRGEPTLTVSVVPDSGTAELAGVSGEMSIEIAEGKHSYTFTYRMDAAEE